MRLARSTAENPASAGFSPAFRHRHFTVAMATIVARKRADGPRFTASLPGSGLKRNGEPVPTAKQR